MYFHVCSWDDRRHIGIELLSHMTLCMIILAGVAVLSEKAAEETGKMLLCLAGNSALHMWWAWCILYFYMTKMLVHKELHGSVRKWSFPLTGDCGLILHCQTLNLEDSEVSVFHTWWWFLNVNIAHCSMIAWILQLAGRKGSLILIIFQMKELIL